MKKTITTPLPKIFAQAFIYMKSRGAAQNVVELVSKDQLEDFIGNTSGYMFKIFKPMP